MTAHIRNDALDEWWVSHLERNQRTQLRLDFAAVLDRRGTTVRIPLDSLSYEETVEPDIFGNRNASANSGGNGTVTATTTPTAPSDGTGTDTATTAPTDAGSTERSGTTAEGTTTNDGGILGDRTVGVAWAGAVAAAERASEPERAGSGNRDVFRLLVEREVRRDLGVAHRVLGGLLETDEYFANL